MTRAKELQIEAVNALEDFTAEAQKLKQEAIINRDEDTANAMLCYEQIITAISSELKMWIELKDDNSSEAWDHLVEAQFAIHTAMQAYAVAQNLDKHAERLSLLEKLLFPPQTFLSQGIIVNPADCECSICGQIYGKCDHIKGRAYMGEMCTRIIKHVREVKEVSIVDSPGNKRCRVYRVGNIDIMTLREVPATSPEHENTNSQKEKWT
jgi:hypothetical protein